MDHTRIIRTALIILAAAAFIVLSVYPSPRRSIAGRVVRWCKGEAGIVQEANDMVEDVIENPKLAGLQQWSVDALHRYESGQLATEKVKYRYMGEVRIADREYPGWLRAAWPNLHEVLIRQSPTGPAECLVFDRGLCGLLVGGTNYRTSFRAWYMTNAAPGIYAYGLYR